MIENRLSPEIEKLLKEQKINQINSSHISKAKQSPDKTMILPEESSIINHNDSTMKF